MIEWQDDFPKEPGYWWFYGWPFGKRQQPDPELCFVEVRKIVNGFMHTTKGFFLYESEAKGKWQKAILPELPTLTQ